MKHTKDSLLIVILVAVAVYSSCARKVAPAGENAALPASSPAALTTATPTARAASNNTAPSSAAPSPSPGEIKDEWQTNFAVFVTQLEEIRKQRARTKNMEFGVGPKYENKRVRWRLPFKSVSQKDNKVTVDFNLEPYGIKYKFFYGTRWVMAAFGAEEAALTEWQAFKRGQMVAFEGVCDTASIMTIRPSDSGVEHFAVFTSIRGVIPIKGARP